MQPHTDKSFSASHLKRRDDLVCTQPDEGSGVIIMDKTKRVGDQQNTIALYWKIKNDLHT